MSSGGEGWKRKGPWRAGLLVNDFGGCIETKREEEGYEVPVGSCFSSPFTYFRWKSYRVENDSSTIPDLSAMNSCFAETKHSKAWMYEDGISLRTV